MIQWLVANPFMAIALIGGLIIVALRSQSILSWLRKQTPIPTPQDTTIEKLRPVLALVEAGKIVKNAEHQEQIRVACLGCFQDFIDAELPRITG